MFFVAIRNDFYLMKNSLLLFPILLGCSAIARADLSYTQVTSSPMAVMMGGAGKVTSKTYAKGNSSRTETQMFGRRTVTIAQGAQKIIQIDPATKTYTVSNSGSAAIARGMMPAGQKPPSISMTVSTQKLAPATIRGVKAPHYRVNMNMQVQTPRGPQTVNMGMEIWNSNIALPTSSKTRSDAMSKLPDNFKTLFGGSAKIKGDLKGMGAAFGTVPLRMKMTMKGQTLSTTETSGISTKPVSAALFSVPKGYRAISNAQFNQMQQAAMQKSMAGMMGGARR